jgi:hypothetical protein
MNESNTAPTHERRDADVVSLIMVATLLLVSGAIVVLGCMGLLHLFTVKEKAGRKQLSKIAQTTAEFPEPRLQTQLSDDLEKLRLREEAELNSYGWIDRQTGVVRIPIDRAMHLIIERGLPEVGSNQTPLQLIQGRPQQSETASPTPKAF